MIEKLVTKCRAQVLVAVLMTAAFGVFVATLHGQGRGRGGGPPQPPEARAAIDLTGYWVSIVTEDWRWRMVTPRRGDYPSVPLTPMGRQLADAWDPAKDTAAGEQCKAYGAPGGMRLPTRLHITWEDPNTLKVELDNGTQTRLFHFVGPQALMEDANGIPVADAPSEPPSLEGYSMAAWEYAGEPARGGAPRKPGGGLKVITRDLKPGYLQKNGVPYSGNTVLTEYFNRTDETNGDSWLFDIATVVDPQYLNAPYVRSTNYKKEPDGSKWDPSPCEAM